MSHRPFPTIEHVWIALLLGAVVAAAGLLPLAPWDFWWHAAAGREIVANGRIPAADQFSYTAAGRPYHYQSWLGEIALFAALSAGGPAGAIWLRVVVVLTTFVVLLWVSGRAARGQLRVAVAATGLAAAGSATNWAVRPQLLSFPLFVAELALLWHWRSMAGRGERRNPPLWPLPLLTALWANVHGAFVLGLVLPALLWLGELCQTRRLTPALRRLGGWTVLATLAALLNPRGVALAGYVWLLLTDTPSQTLIAEWRPPTLASGEGRLFFAALLLSAPLLLRQRQALRLGDWLWWAGFALLASRGVRYVTWFFFVLAPLLALVLARSLERWAPAGQERLAGVPRVESAEWSHRLNAALVATLTVLALMATPAWKDHLPLPQELRGLVTADTPVAAAAILEQKPPRHLFHDMGHGSYLIWRWRGSPPVFIDPRVELYPLAHWNDYATTVAAEPGWQEVLDRWQVDTLLLDRDRQAALIVAATAAGWRERWSNGQTVILDREAQP